MAVSNVQSDGLLPLPIGSRFSISDSALEWVSLGVSGPRWYADLPTRLAAWQHPFDYYENDFADFPVLFSYGWNRLGPGQEGTFLEESFDEFDHDSNSLTLRYTFGLWENFARTALLMCRYELERVPGEVLQEEVPEMVSAEAMTLLGW